MTEKNQDAGSDASRTDPKTADKDREELKRKAEQGMKDAVGKPPSDQTGD